MVKQVSARNVQLVNGFTALHVKWSRLPFCHVLYLKEHRSRKEDQELPSDRTLFVANCNLEEEDVKRLFECFGNVERVKMGEFACKRIGHPGKDTLAGATQISHGERHAHIVFEMASACRAALSCSKTLVDPEPTDRSTSFLSAVIAAHHSRNVASEELQASVDSYLAAFDERSEAEKRARREGLIDEDGFQLVTYKRKNRHFDPLTIEAPIQRKSKELGDFYRFQIRERKRAEVATLRTKFEADKKRIESMRLQRKFRPF